MMSIEAAILDRLWESAPCSFDDLVAFFPDLTWGEVFSAVDRMSRDGRLSLRQVDYSNYEISLGPRFVHASSTSSQTGQTTGKVIQRPQVSTL
jgi:hypothetical protein